MAAAVNDVSDAVQAISGDWAMIDTLIGGTSAMRKAASTYLPMFPAEAAESYAARLKSATLFPAYRRTLSVMAGKPFSSQLQLSDDTPADIQTWANDIDREGVSLHVFAAEMFAESFAGLAGILVEAPVPLPISGRPPTVAEQAQAGIRPYWVRIKHNQILGWKVTGDGGARRLRQFRFMECVTEDDGDFGTADIQQVRVLVPGGWSTWRENPTTKLWFQQDAGTVDLDVIPFVPLYGSRIGFMQGLPPLRDLAHLNVKHWQSQSDQDTILHAARVPILFAKGFAATEDLVVGAGTAVKVENSTADLKWVEHTGAAIEAGAAAIAAIEDQMIQAGAELMVNKPGAKTATEDANDAEGNRCDLARQVEDFEDALDMALDLTARFARLPNGGKATLFKDFGVSSLSDASATLIQQLAVGGIISKATAITELQRRGELSPDIDPEDEAEAVANEGPALGALVPPAEPPEPKVEPGPPAKPAVKA